jgi:hypothetical protein
MALLTKKYFPSYWNSTASARALPRTSSEIEAGYQVPS